MAGIEPLILFWKITSARNLLVLRFPLHEMINPKHSRPKRPNQKIRRCAQVLVICVIGGVLFNVLVLHARLEDQARNNHRFYLDKLSPHHSYHEYLRAGLRLRTRIRDEETRESEFLILRLTDVLEKRWIMCKRQMRGAGLLRDHGTTTGDDESPFGLLKVMKQTRPSISRNITASTSERRTNDGRIVVVVSSTGKDIRSLFINLLKWLYMQDMTTSKNQRSEDSVQSVPIVIEKVWLLIPSKVIVTWEQDGDFGQRILAWNRTEAHPLGIRDGNNFLQALSGAELSLSSNIPPILFLDGDRPSPSGKHLLHLLDLRLRKWYQDPSIARMSTVISNSQTAVSENQRKQFSGQDICKITTDNRLLPEVHFSVHEASRVRSLQHLSLAYMPNHTNGAEDWNLSYLKAALLLAWLAYEYMPGPEDPRSLNFSMQEEQNVLRMLSYIGGIPRPFSSG